MAKHQRAVDDRCILDRFCEGFWAIVAQHTRYVIVSGFLAIAAGRAARRIST